MPRHKVAAIVAMDEDRVIGFENRLPWHIPEDLKRFSALTKGHTVLMGRNTWESLPIKFRPLPERLNIVVTRNPSTLDLPTGVLTYDSPEKCLRDFLSDKIAAPSKELWIIGGQQIFEATKNYWSELYLTLVHSKHTGDTFFLPFENDFEVVQEENKGAFSFKRYVRKAKK